MAIESAAFLRRLARIVTLVLIVAFLGCIPAAAQAPVTVGSVVSFNHPAYGQIYRIVVAHNGSVLFLDAQNGAIYQLAPGSTTLAAVAPAGDTLKGGGNFWNEGMAVDQWDNIYVGGRYSPQPDFYRVPYNPATGTWSLTSGDSWAAGNTALGSSGVYDIAFDDSSNMIVSSQSGGLILKIPVDVDGNVGTVTTLVKNLTDAATKIAVDHAGNVFFIEDPFAPRSAVAEGVWMIPSGASGIVGETSPAVRIDPAGLHYNFKGIRVNAAGDLYFSSQDDKGGNGNGNANMVLMVPNESGSPKTATQATLNWNHAVMVAPVTSPAPVEFDPRGFLWIPTGTGGWVPPGSTEVTAPVYPGTLNFVLWTLGSANLGASPIGTTGTTGTVYFMFNGTTATTPAKIAISQPGSGSDFTTTGLTNPILNVGPPTSVDTTVVPCTAGVTYQPTPTGISCPYWVALNPRVTGAVSGQLQMLDSSNKVIGQGGAFVYGEGRGSAVSILSSSVSSAIGSGFSAPGQVAVDSVLNAYVADAGQGKVLKYPGGTSILSGLTAPTGVAVDGSGNVYIGDAGQIIEVPFGSTTGNVILASTAANPLGSHLNLAVDGAGNVYAADPDNKQVVKVPNPAEESTILSGSFITVGTGFNAPSAVAVDGSGNIFVADGNNLVEVSTWFGQSNITAGLAGPVTALATDASGSVYVAESGGVIRIPNEAQGLTFNDKVAVAAGITTPTGLAMDSAGNLFVSSSGTPGVTKFGVNGTLDFGIVTPNVETDQEVQLFNIGNLPLTLSPLAGDLFTGANLGDFLLVTAGDTPACDPAVPIAAGMPCYLGVGVLPTTPGNGSASVAILSDASNAPSVALAVSDNAVVDTRCTTTTTISPIAATTYPGVASIVATVALVPGQAGCSGTPQGQVDIKVTGQGKTPVQLDSTGVATLSLTNLQGGGPYKINAVYQGFGTAGTPPDFAVSVAAPSSFNVILATPSVTIGAPVPVYDNLYVEVDAGSTLMVTVSSTVGVPTGTVAFMNGAALADPTQGPITLSGNGTATFETKLLPVGVYNLTAVYSGDQNYAPTTIPIPTFQVVHRNVLITATPPSLTLTPGVPGTVSLNFLSIANFGGINSVITLGCTNSTLPQYSECTFDKTSITVPIGGSTTVVMTISTNVPVNIGNVATVRSATSPWALAGLFSFGLIGLAFGRKTRFYGRAITIICLMLLFAGSVIGVTACSNSGYTHTPPAPHVTTPAGTKAVIVTAKLNGENGQVISLPFTLNVTVQ